VEEKIHANEWLYKETQPFLQLAKSGLEEMSIMVSSLCFICTPL